MHPCPKRPFMQFFQNLKSYFKVFFIKNWFFFQFCKSHGSKTSLKHMWFKYLAIIIKPKKLMRQCSKRIYVMCKKLSQFIWKMFMKNMKHGWVKHTSNLWKVQHAWLFHIVKLLNLYEQKTFTPLNYKDPKP